jgi:hypothetical protein
MFKSILSSANLQSVLLGQLRHFVTIGGTLLATSGYIGGSDVEALTGAVMVIASLIMSALSKRLAA